MTKPLALKHNPKAAWLKQLRSGEDGSVWRIAGEAVDHEMRSARKVLDKAAMPYAARDLVRLTDVLLKTATLPGGIVVLAKARLDCEGLAYTAADLVEMIALLVGYMDCAAETMAEDEAAHVAMGADCSGQVRH